MWGKNYFLKVLGVVLVTYALIVGLLLPLGSGIASLDTYQLNEENNFTVRANTHNVIVEDGLEVFLKFSRDLWLKASSVNEVSSNLFEIKFDIKGVPDKFKRKSEASLAIIGSPYGAAVLPRALVVEFSDIAEPTDLMRQPSFEEVKTKTTFPYRNILKESIRNLFYHVPMWFAMIILCLMAAIYGIRYLNSFERTMDLKAEALLLVAFLLGMLGLVTGSIWAKNTWGAFWTDDVKLNMSAVVVLMYGTYLIFRRVIKDKDRMRRVTSAYNIFCFASMIPLLFIVPRIQDSLHPGNGGNPGFGGEDLDGTMRWVFYPAIVGWTLIALWIANLWYRINKINFGRIK